MDFDYTELGLKKARRYLKQFHPKEWNKVKDEDGYHIVIAAVEAYDKGWSRKNILRNIL